jgi:hypothetical protein
MEAIINVFDMMNIKDSVKNAMRIEKKYGYKIRRYFTNDDIMIGGGDNFTKFEFEKYIFNFMRTAINDTVHYKLFIDDDEQNLPECLYIIYDKIDKAIVLENLFYDKKCFNNSNMENEYKLCGSLLLSVGLKFVKKLRKKYDIKYIQLTDESIKYCNGTEINFALMHTLLYGDTWYGKKGFKPKVSSKYTQKNIYKIDNGLLKLYENNKKIIKNIKVNDIPKLKNYLIDSYNEVKPKNITIDKIIKMYEKHKNNKLSILDVNCSVYYCIVKIFADRFLQIMYLFFIRASNNSLLESTCDQ